MRILIAAALVTIFSIGLVAAQQHILNADQKERLKKLNAVYVQAIALQEEGIVDASPIKAIAVERMNFWGYHVIDKNPTPSDITLKIKCEERKSSLGLTEFEDDVNRSGLPDRLWKGPACQLTYWIDGEIGPWRQEIRTNFEDALEASKVAGVKDVGAFALGQLQSVLRQSDFPLVLASEWKQDDRLVRFLTSPDTDHSIKLRVISLVKKVPAPSIFLALKKVVSVPTLATEAIHTLGYMGVQAIPVLLELLETTQHADIKAFTAQALGNIVAQNGNSIEEQVEALNAQVATNLISVLEASGNAIQVQIEIVRALGRVPDQRSLEPLEELRMRAWTSSSSHPKLKELRDVIENSIWQLNPGAGGYE